MGRARRGALAARSEPRPDKPRGGAAPTAFLRGAATEGARGRWSKLTKQLLQAAKERKARTFSEAMPAMVAAPGMGAFTFAEPAPKTARGDEGGGGAAKLSRRERAALLTGGGHHSGAGRAAGCRQGRRPEGQERAAAAARLLDGRAQVH